MPDMAAKPQRSRAARPFDRSYYTVGSLLARQAKALGRQPALVWEGGAWSYAEIDRRSRALATALRARGIGPGTSVLLMLDNHADYILLWLALARIGAIEVPVNTAYLGDLLRHVTASSGATVLIAEAGYLERFTDAVTAEAKLARLILRGEAAILPPRLARLQRHGLGELLAETATDDAPDERDPQKIMAVMYTSGTTGASKGVLCSYAHALEYSRCVVEVLDLRKGDRYYNVLPLFHIAGQWAAVFACFIAGSTAILKPRFSVSAFWPDIRHFRCNVTLLLGAMANLLYRAAPARVDRKHPLDKILVVPLFPEIRDFERRFGVRVTTNYGSTEVGVPLRSGFNRRKPRLFQLANARSCGRVVDDRFEVRVVDDRDREVPPGTPGELVVRPRVPWIVMAGYLNEPAKTVEAWRNLWLHTGDLMMRDKAGNYYFLDRIKDAIRRRGENISSIEIENGILQFAKILECAVYPVPSPLTEQEVMAAVVAKPDTALDLVELNAFLETALPKFMVPRYYRLATTLPKTPTGKIQKVLLRNEGLGAPHWDREATAGNDGNQQRPKRH